MSCGSLLLHPQKTNMANPLMLEIASDDAIADRLFKLLAARGRTVFNELVNAYRVERETEALNLFRNTGSGPTRVSHIELTNLGRVILRNPDLFCVIGGNQVEIAENMMPAAKPAHERMVDPNDPFGSLLAWTEKHFRYGG